MTDESISLSECAQRVELARKRLDDARLAHEESAEELRSAKAAAETAEETFIASAWGEFGLPTPLDRFVSGGSVFVSGGNVKLTGPRDRPATVKG